MGGDARDLHVQMSSDAVNRAVAAHLSRKPSIATRLLRLAMRIPHVPPIPESLCCQFELASSPAADEVRRAYLAFLDASFPHPWAATRWVRRYLRDAFRVWIGGVRNGPDSPWMLCCRLLFMGNAGMADTSSHVAAHCVA